MLKAHVTSRAPVVENGQQEPLFSGFFRSLTELFLALHKNQIPGIGRIARPASGLWKLAAATAQSVSIAFHLWSFFATLTHESLFFVSLPFVSSVSSSLRKSFISPSHLFFGLPTGLFVWCLVLKPGFHFAAFFAHRSSGSEG